MDWLEEEIGEYEDDYLLIDCPGVSRPASISSVLFPLTQAFHLLG